MSSPPAPFAPTALVPPVLNAVRSMNAARVVSLLDESALRHGYDVTVDEVVFPALRVVGTFWASGTLDVAHERVLSSGVTRWVYAQLDRQVVHRRGRIVLAAGPQDLHTVGLDCLELLLAQRGVEVCNLGGQAPARSLVLAAGVLDAGAVVVCSHSPTATSAAVASITAVAESGHPVYYAGAAFQSQFVRRHAPGRPLDGTLAESADLLTRLHTTAAGTGPDGPVPTSAAPRGRVVAGPPSRSSRARPAR